LIPWKIEGLPHLLLVIDNPKTSLGIRVEESDRIAHAFHRRRSRYRVPSRQIKQSLNGFIWKVPNQLIEVIFRYLTHGIEPFCRDAKRKKIIGFKLAKQRRLRLLLNNPGDFADRFELRSVDALPTGTPRRGDRRSTASEYPALDER